MRYWPINLHFACLLTYLLTDMRYADYFFPYSVFIIIIIII